MFDVTVAAPWPKGVYLCLRLSERGLKTCYVETAPEKGPFALFLDESAEEEEAFWRRLFSLERLEAGLSVVSEQGAWGLQSHALPGRAMKKALNKDLSGPFKDSWLSFFAINYTSRLFVHNTSLLGAKPLPLFEDCFLAAPSAAKKTSFLEEERGVLWINGARSQLQIKGEQVFLRGEAHKTRKALFLHQPSFKALRPDFQWMSLLFECDMKGGYEEVIPPHFILIDRLRSPWALGNMLSVFKERRSRYRIWLRAPFSLSDRAADVMRNEAAASLSRLFKAPAKLLGLMDRGFAVYGESALRFLKKNRPLFARFPEGLRLEGEKELFQQTIENL